MVVELYWRGMLDQLVDISNAIFNGDGLSPDPGIFHSVQTRLFFERRNGYKEEELD